ncbi:MAG: carboxypeptidase regulatory-like domain-containing protein [Terriglobia bacterium]
MKRSNIAYRVALVLLVAFTPTLVRAQAVASAQIHGVVSDPSGAVIPGAQVRAIETNTEQVRTTVSNGNGAYMFPNLPVGPYRLEVSSPGFEAYAQSGIVLQVDNNVQINVTLRVGTVSQQVQVSAGAEMVQTQDTSVSEVVDQRRINDLPLNGRQATDLILLTGGAVEAPDSGRVTSSHDYPSAVGISVAGGQMNGNNYLLDGSDNNDSHSNVNLPFPFPDALQEFSVQTNGVSSRYGLHPGSVINVVTKSGTNQFHGDLFEFVRNGAFNARNYFAPTQDTLRRNQFGGTIGGPIKKDKLFFFFGYQGTRTRTAPPQSIDFVPTQAMLNGDFSAFESASCQSNGKARTIIDPSTGQPFANDFVNPSSFSRQALALLKYVPISSNPCGKLTYSIPTPSGEDQYIGRVDWSESAKNSLFSRYFITDYNAPPFFDGSNMLTTTKAAFADRSQSLLLADTYGITPTTLNSIHATWARLSVNRAVSQKMISPNQVGIKINQLYPHFIYLNVANSLAMGGGSNAPGYYIRNQAQLADDVDIVKGRQQITFGGELIHIQFNVNNLPYGNGYFDVTGQLTNDPLLDFMLGRLSTFSAGDPQELALRQSYVGLYAQDDIQVSKRLNVHVGVRWEPLLPAKDAAGRGSHFSTSAFAAGVKTSLYTNAPAGLLFYGDPGIPPGYAYNSLADFAPRLGLAWDPTGSGKNSIRASYGIFNDTPMSYNDAHFATSPPWGSTITLNDPPGGLADPFANYPGGDPFPTPLPPPKDAFFPTQGSYVNLPLNLHHTYMQQWDLSYQHQFSANWLVSATYVGNKTTHLWSALDQNSAVYIPGTCGSADCSTVGNTNQRRLLYLMNPTQGAFYSSLALLDDGDNTNYNGLILTVQHRFSRNFTLLSNYTYSHCLQDAEPISDKLSGAEYQNPFNRNADYSNCDFDVRHNFNASMVFQSPRLRNRWANAVLGGWQVAPLISVHSGFWFSPLTGVDASLSGVGLDRPNVTGNPYIENTSTRQWLNASSFSKNAKGAYGNAGAYSLIGPGYFDMDADVSRYFNIRENQRLELRFEFFNSTNQVNFNAPTNSLKSASFGKILSAGGPRILQFALKYYF